MGTPLEDLMSLEAAIIEIVTDIYEPFLLSYSTEEDIATNSPVVARYIDRVDRIAASARAAGLNGLHYACVHFGESLRMLQRHELLLSVADRELLEEWPMRVMAHAANPLDQEAVESLIAHVRKFPSGSLQSDEEIAAIREAFLAVNEPVADSRLPMTTGEPAKNGDDLQADSEHEARMDPEDVGAGPACWSQADSGAANTAQLDSISAGSLPESAIIGFDFSSLAVFNEEVQESMGALFRDLDAESHPGTCSSIPDALNLCADRIELIGMSAAAAGFMGLMDLCVLFQSGLRNLAEHGGDLAAGERQRLHEWPRLLADFLADPTDEKHVENILASLTGMSWAPAVTADELARLHDLLIPEQIELEQLPADPGDALKHDLEPEYGAEDVETLGIDDNAACADNMEENAADADRDEAGWSEAGLELVSMVRLEIEDTIPGLSGLLSIAECPDEIAAMESMANYSELVSRFALAAESVGLTGLQQVLKQVQENVRLIAERGMGIGRYERALLEEWPLLTARYLSSLGNRGLCDSLVEYLRNPFWPEPLTGAAAAPLLAQLASPNLAVEDDLVQRQTEALPEDVSLELPEDVNPQLLDSLLQELPQHTAEFTESITRIVDGKGDLGDVHTAQRLAHTLKGSANTVGVVGIATLTHHLEDILLAFSKHERLPGRALASVLLSAADALEMMSEALLGLIPAPAHARDVLQQVLDWANRIDREGITEDQSSENADPAAVADTDEKPVSRNAGRPHDAAGGDAGGGAILRVPASLVDELMRLAGESMIVTGQLQDRLRQAKLELQSVHEQNRLFQQLAFELEQVVDIQGITRTYASGRLDDDFDTLEFDQYNELHTVTRRLVEAATDSQELARGVEEHLASLDNLLVGQHRLHKKSQEVVMHTRMIPVQNVVPRLQRSVRQTCRLTGKQVELQVSGSGTLIDSDVLNDLLDPLMHVLRNAVDHGIESHERRVAAGKMPAGKIDLRFRREGDQIVVRCQDDGSGLDFATIRSTAIQKGLLTPGQELPDDELTRLILLPGFTTRKDITQVSGRGIGMDAVHKQILSMKGSLNIESQRGQGVTVEMWLPLTLISMHAVLIEAGKQAFAVSSRGVEQILYHGEGTAQTEGGKLIYEFGDHVYDAFDIEALLRLPGSTPSLDGKARPAMLVRDDTGTVRAILIEEVLSTQDLVVKQLGQYVPQVIGVDGATILGDGSVVSVLDLPALLRTAGETSLAPMLENPDTLENETDTPCALVVDDSLSARRSLADFVRDMGYEVHTARDGLEAIDVMQSKTPDLLLVDLEMPRMNGLELASHVRASAAISGIPIIMITSRSTEKHRKQAKAAGVDVYLTKPFSEDELLEYIRSTLARA